MAYSRQELWLRFQKFYSEFKQLGLSIDLSRVNFPDDLFDTIAPQMRDAFIAMDALERGAIANKDENRMVGHYWLRNPSLAPTDEIRKEIEDTVTHIKSFSAEVHAGKIQGTSGRFTNLLLIGIGGSALGPQFVSHALGNVKVDKLKIYFFDNTDPDGIDNTLSYIGEQLGQTLCIVISKSGGTKETRNGMLEAKAAYERAGLHFESHVVAVTSLNSELDKLAVSVKWIARFPMWDWVGGRTSELSAVGLLPACLQGIDIDSLLAGAKACDAVTRCHDIKRNPSAQLALMWHHIGNGKGTKNMVVLPYKDRLELFAKYLQQLLMESLGKATGVNGNVVHQGITVLGNKGATDQHSYIQQLRDGLDNFFVTFIRVLRDRSGKSIMVDPEVTSGDYLDGFFQGTRQALFENGRQSITITVNEVSPFAVGVLIALFERAVGLYASLINVNPYHQPGVEAGKKAATSVIDYQLRVLQFLNSNKKRSYKAIDIATQLGIIDQTETLFLICQHLAANPDHGIESLPNGFGAEASFQAA